MVRLGLQHASRGDEFGYKGGEEAVSVEKLQAFGCSVWGQDGVEFVVDALGSDLGEQGGVAHEETFGVLVDAQVVAHHEAYCA